MDSPLSGREILDREFLPMRAKTLEIAATLDRISRAGHEIDDPRLRRLREGLELLLTLAGDRAEGVQLLFSRPYDEGWRETLDVE